MITLFENITGDLTDLERTRLVPDLIRVLLQHSSKDNRITGRRLCKWFMQQGYKVTQIRLCKMVSYIRQCNLVSPMVLIGSSRGYFTTNDPEIVRDQIESLRGRVFAITAVIDSLEAQRDSITKNSR